MPTALTLALTLIQGIGIMALVTMCYSHVERSDVSAMNKALLHGLAFGVGSVFCLVLATEVESGVFIDARNLFIAFSAAFCGPVALAVTLVLAATTRIMMGGVAVYAGLLGLVIAGAGGLLWRYVLSGRIRNRELALTVLGLLTALSLLRFITLPDEISLPLLMVISLPVIAVDLMGALMLGSFIEREQRLLRREQELEADAFTDPLTGLLNRRRFESLASSVLSNPADGSPGAALAIIDIDHFKRVNDTHGHDVGDKVLRVAARRLSELARPQDLVSRMGGEEFALLIRDVDREGALAIAEQLRLAIAESPMLAGSETIAITISIGLRHSDAPSRFLECYRAADQALYAAKSGGRNRAECASHRATQQDMPKAA